MSCTSGSCSDKLYDNSLLVSYLDVVLNLFVSLAAFAFIDSSTVFNDAIVLILVVIGNIALFVVLFLLVAIVVLSILAVLTVIADLVVHAGLAVRTVLNRETDEISNFTGRNFILQLTTPIRTQLSILLVKYYFTKKCHY